MDIRKFFGSTSHKNNTAPKKTNINSKEVTNGSLKMTKNTIISSDDESIIPSSVINKQKMKVLKENTNVSKKKLKDKNYDIEITPTMKVPPNIVIPKKLQGDEIQKLKKKVSKKKNDYLDEFIEEDEEEKPKKKRLKAESHTVKSKKSLIPDEHPNEGDKNNGAALYNSFLHREGPKALGTREIPQGQENCFEGLTFVITGILETLERDQCKELIETYGGKVTQSISKKTSYLISGREPGPSKISKAKECRVKHLDEDGFYKILQTLPAQESKYLIYNAPEVGQKQLGVADENSFITTDKQAVCKNRLSYDNSNLIKNLSAPKGKKRGKIIDTREEEDDELEILDEDIKTVKTENSQVKIFSPDVRGLKHTIKKVDKERPIEVGSSLMWVDKYKPIKVDDIIGQQGDKSSLNKLINWLQDWFIYNEAASQSSVKSQKPLKSSKFKKSADSNGSSYKAALLSGPPGVGKTTSAILSCKELGFTFTELNASNIRSKKYLKDLFAESLSTYNMSNYIKGIPSQFKHHVLIMDEVDGMAGNEDRGGIQELIALIKSTKLPIICICNQRSDPKMRTLVNYCYDLRFSKPRAEQIKEAMMKMLYNEKVTIEPAIVQRVIGACNNDIRQVIHSLNMLSSDNKSLKYVQIAGEIKDMKKDTRLDDFEITRTVFTADASSSKNSLNTKSDLFFMDYSMVPLFVQENYLLVQPHAASRDVKLHLELISKSADFMSDADLMSNHVFKTNNWSLLPLIAITSTAAPGEFMKGYFNSMIAFPKFFGKLSKGNKFKRMIKELKMHMVLRTCSDWRAINLDYLTPLKNELSVPLTPHALKHSTCDESNAEFLAIQRVLATMNYYYLLKEDLENITEISKWDEKWKPIGGSSVRKNRHAIVDHFAQINPKLKAALTRAYTKASFKIPYLLERSSEFGMVRKSARASGTKNYGDQGDIELDGGGGDGDLDDNFDEASEEENGNKDPDFIGKDKMIKQKKVTTASKTASKPRGRKKQ